jgi:hypothetical protein
MQRITELAEINTELAVINGRFDSLFSNEILPSVYADAALVLDSMEQSGSDEQTEALKNLRTEVIDGLQARIIDLTAAQTDFSIGGLDIYRFISAKGPNVYVTRDGRRITHHYPGFVRFAGVTVTHVTKGDVVTIEDYRALAPELRAEENYSFLRPISQEGAVEVLYHADDSAYQYLLDKENLTSAERLEKARKEQQEELETAKSGLSLAVFRAGISKLVGLENLLSQHLTPVEYSSEMRAGLRLVGGLFPRPQ